MKQLLATVMACVCALGLFADVSPIYLKAGATGAGDGSSWADAMTDVYAAISLADETGRPVYAARGYYQLTNQRTLTSGLEFYGGFPGVSDSETLEDRDTAKYQTIVSQVAATSLKWNHAMPQSGQFSISVAALNDAENPVIVTDNDGYPVFNPPPAPEGDFDGYYVSGGSSRRFVNAGANMDLTVDGVWFIGFATDPSIQVDSENANCGVRTINDCRFFGAIGPKLTHVGYIHSDILSAKITNCEFRHAYNLKPVLELYGHHSIVEDCAFSDIFRTDVKNGNEIIYVKKNRVTVRGCSFERCVAVTKSDGESPANGAANLIGWSSNENNNDLVQIEDCTMTHNLSMAQYGYGCSLFAGCLATQRNLMLVGNRLEVKAKAAGTYSLVAASLRNTVKSSYENCLFASNEVAEVVGEAAAEEGGYALGILGDGIEKKNTSSVVNCTFLDNAVTTVGSSANVVRSQGVLFNDSSASASRMTVVNCAFARTEEDAGIYDVAQVGSTANDFYVLNSIFTRGPSAQYEPFYADTPAKFKVRSCSVGGYLNPPDWLDCDEIATDAVPLEDLAISGGLHTLRPACRMPSLRDSVTVSVCTRTANAIESGGKPYYVSYMIRNDADTGWIALTGETAPSSALGVMADATGAARPSDAAFTRGPVQTLSAAAEEGNALIVRSDPYGAGDYTPGWYQIVAPNSAPAPVTAAAKDPDSVAFDHWVTAGGEVTDNPLALGVLPEGVTAVTAVFSVPKKTMTFELGEYGTFEGGATRLAVEMIPGAAFVVPPVIPSDDWVITGWSPAIPAKVPSEDTTFTATAVTKDLRVIRLAPADDPVAAGGKGDGSSWEDAYRGNLAAAYADAATYRGEVWIKTGAYDVAAPIHLKPRVRVIGGFTGDETSADVADPVANPVILTGDLNHDNYWRVNAAGSSVGEVVDYGNLVVNEPQPANRETYWAANGNNTDNAESCFIGDEPLSECALEGLVVTCFKKTAVKTEATSPLKLVKCRFLANNTGINLGAANGAFVAKGTIDAEDCEFSMSHTPLTVQDAGASETDPIRLTRCRFRLNYGATQDSGGGFSMDTPNRDLVLDGCEITDNFGFEYQLYQRCIVHIENARSLTMRNTLVARNTYKNRAYSAFYIRKVSNGLFVDNCVFRDNQKIGHGNNTEAQNAAAFLLGTIDPFNNTVQSSIRNTLFESNSVVRQAECNSGTGHLIHQASVLRLTVGLIAFVNCSFVGNSCEVFSGATVATGSSAATIQTGGNAAYPFFVNCVFSGNAAKGEVAGDLRLTSGAANTPVVFANTVLDGAGQSGYEPIVYGSTADKLPFMAAHCRISGYTAAKYADRLGTYGFDIGNSAEIPTVAKTVATGQNGVRALPVRGTSKQGVPVSLAPNGFYYLHLPEYNEAKPYLRQNTAAASMAVAALPEESVVNADAFGVVPTNRKARPSLGPVNDKNGLMVLLK